MTSRERVEAFHLLFLRALFSHLEDRSLVILKGGANLRFYFASPRFSEDMDLDVRTIATRTLAHKVEALLEPRSALTRVLGTHRLRIASLSAPKQTDDVQRWKISIQEDGGTAESTKVEFSRRRAGRGVTEAIPAPVLERHLLPGPIVATHYGADDAAAQKIAALVGRAAPQARDVFDLNLLIGGGARLPRLAAKERALAVERALGFSRSDFEGQVLAFLEPDERAVYESAEAIEAVQLRVVDALEKARP